MATVYCWKCDRDVAMFDEREWLRIRPLLDTGIRAVKDYRAEHGVPLAEVPMRGPYAELLAEHVRIAGHANVRPEDVWHHRRADHGPPCRRCGKPLRTPGATRCVLCPCVH
ncbi:MAG: hypothetical protein NXI31_22240 [bacterium]|nr:hypothetical protein [bacterium]